MSPSISQNLYLNDSTTVTVVKCNFDALSLQHLQPLLDTAVADRVLGIAATYKKNCQLSSIAFSTLSRALVVDVSAATKGAKRRVTKNKSLIQDRLLLNPEFTKYTFMMDQLATALYLDLSIRIDNAVDMLSVSNANRESLQALMNAMGGEVKLQKENVHSLFFDLGSTMDDITKLTLKAWAAYRAATLPHMSPRFANIRRINTKAFTSAHLVALATISRHAARLESLKPLVVKNDVKDNFTATKNDVNISCDRYSNRIKCSQQQVVRIEIQHKETTTRVTGQARHVSGRSVRIQVDKRIQSGKITSVTTIGKQDLTCAESDRRVVILKALQRSTTILSNPFFQTLWLPKERPLWPEFKERREEIPVHFSRELNRSQHAAVKRILSDKDEDRIVIIQGPPGTGKTTVIVASVISHDNVKSSQKIWIAAQSNVAVKNIAEKLIKEGFHGFRLLVSKDFHFDWHEHLYEELERCVIRSDSFPQSDHDAQRSLLGCKVILCTLSMFSNPEIGAILRIVPVEMIILDEASQIECGGYLSVIHRFQTMLSKLVFIGDDKQLPPYGQEDIPQLRSVFEFPHLRKRALFLDTQYRMPHVIGAFISQNVYDGKLQTFHSFTTPKACRFIDVKNGQEVKQGCSWTNHEEARVVVKLVREFGSINFRIITPYDAQRSLIEKMLKSDDLPWEDKVFNVDSFQGNEDDYIIVSVVRSRKIGFLQSQRRTNVMLTRCKEHMIICSSRSFLFGEASKTLVGKLAASVDSRNWIDAKQVLGAYRIQMFA